MLDLELEKRKDLQGIRTLISALKTVGGGSLIKFKNTFYGQI